MIARPISPFSRHFQSISQCEIPPSHHSTKIALLSNGISDTIYPLCTGFQKVSPPPHNMDSQVSQEALAFNFSRVHNLYPSHSRTFQSIFGGITTGVLGFNGFWGFAMFLVYSLVGTVLLWGSLGGKSGTYFVNVGQLLGGWKTGLMEYLLFWIMFYNIVYILS